MEVWNKGGPEPNKDYGRNYTNAFRGYNSLDMYAEREDQSQQIYLTRYLSFRKVEKEKNPGRATTLIIQEGGSSMKNYIFCNKY